MTELVADYPQPEYQISLPSVSSFGQETHLNQTQTQNNGGQPEVLGQTYDTQVNYQHFYRLFLYYLKLFRSIRDMEIIIMVM